jgi:hypothetical protein
VRRDPRVPPYHGEADRQLPRAAAEAKGAKAEAARQAALPHNRTSTPHSLYARAAFCNEVREGYMLQYVKVSEFFVQE